MQEVLDNFVVLEGLDGSGTTTQLKNLAVKLKEANIPHCCTGEPTDGYVGKIIRSILNRKLEAAPETLALLFAADRSEHLRKPREGILDRLQRGELVVCDRYLFSSLAYQSPECGFDFVLALNRRFPLPRHLIFIDTPIDVSQDRLNQREGKEIFDRPELQSTILEAYHRAFDYFAGSGMRLHRIDGSLPAEHISTQLWNILRSLPML